MTKKEKQFEAVNKSRYRDLLTTIMKNPPEKIWIGEWDERGDLSFSVNMMDIGLTYVDYNNYEDEFFSYFMIDLIGELLVRENLHLFVKKFENYNIDDYMAIVEEVGVHHRFGIKTYKGHLVFKFHISFLRNLLTENLREDLG